MPRPSAGWGEPVFDKSRHVGARHDVHSATRGFEIGEGFAATRMRGSQHNDPHAREGGGIRPASNHCGGIQGGISNGEPFFPRGVQTRLNHLLPRKTVAFDGTHHLEAKGRHDPSVLPRAVPVVESMAALVLADAFLQQQTQRIPRLESPQP